MTYLIHFHLVAGSYPSKPGSACSAAAICPMLYKFCQDQQAVQQLFVPCCTSSVRISRQCSSFLSHAVQVLSGSAGSAAAICPMLYKFCQDQQAVQQLFVPCCTSSVRITGSAAAICPMQYKFCQDQKAVQQLFVPCCTSSVRISRQCSSYLSHAIQVLSGSAGSAAAICPMLYKFCQDHRQCSSYLSHAVQVLSGSEGSAAAICPMLYKFCQDQQAVQQLFVPCYTSSVRISRQCSSYLSHAIQLLSGSAGSAAAICPMLYKFCQDQQAVQQLFVPCCTNSVRISRQCSSFLSHAVQVLSGSAGSAAAFCPMLYKFYQDQQAVQQLFVPCCTSSIRISRQCSSYLSHAIQLLSGSAGSAAAICPMLYKFCQDQQAVQQLFVPCYTSSVRISRQCSSYLSHAIQLLSGSAGSAAAICPMLYKFCQDQQAVQQLFVPCCTNSVRISRQCSSFLSHAVQVLSGSAGSAAAFCPMLYKFYQDQQAVQQLFVPCCTSSIRISRQCSSFLSHAVQVLSGSAGSAAAFCPMLYKFCQDQQAVQQLFVPCCTSSVRIRRQCSSFLSHAVQVLSGSAGSAAAIYPMLYKFCQDQQAVQQLFIPCCTSSIRISRQCSSFLSHAVQVISGSAGSAAAFCPMLYKFCQNRSDFSPICSTFHFPVCFTQCVILLLIYHNLLHAILWF